MKFWVRKIVNCKPNHAMSGLRCVDGCFVAYMYTYTYHKTNDRHEFFQNHGKPQRIIW